MDELDTLLADFNRLKENCRKLEKQKIVVGIVGSAGSRKTAGTLVYSRQLRC